MILWRISRHISLNGEGGLQCNGRWHTMGSKIVYCAENPATALLETLVHSEIDVEDMPSHFTYLEIQAPDNISTERVESSSISPKWFSEAGITQTIGNNWLRSVNSALLFVPSVIVPKTVNVLINPAHPEAASIEISQMHRHVRDLRMAAR